MPRWSKRGSVSGRSARERGQAVAPSTRWHFLQIQRLNCYLAIGTGQASQLAQPGKQEVQKLMISEQWKDFQRPKSRGPRGREKDFAEGTSIFLRLDDGARCSLTSELIRAWQCELPLNRAMASGALRQAWESEPYFGAVRCGSFVSKVAYDEGEENVWTMDEFAEDWGPELMTAEEKAKLEEGEARGDGLPPHHIPGRDRQHP